MEGDGRIINRLLSIASSYMPYNDSNYNTPSSTAHNTPKRQPRRSDCPGERWERSVERWDNSPKVSRQRKQHQKTAASVNRAKEASSSQDRRQCHARSDSGSSSGSTGEQQQHQTKSTVSSINTTTITEHSNDDRTEALGDDVNATSCDNVENSTNCVASSNDKSAAEDAVYNSNCQPSIDSSKPDIHSQSEDSLSDIAEEEHPSQTLGTSRSFFSRNAPERLSNLIRRGVGGADEKLRGFWRKGVSRSGSKDSMGSISSNGSGVSSPNNEKIISPVSSVGDLENRGILHEMPSSTSTPAITKSALHVEPLPTNLVSSYTDQRLFKMKGAIMLVTVLLL